jgi:protein-tyrosine phosphatase
MSDGSSIGVLFVCYANICRSPLAEGVFRHMVAERGMGARFVIDSAGVAAVPGHPPHPLSIEIAADYGIELVGASRPFVPEDLERFDQVVAMDRDNYGSILEVAAGRPLIRPRARVRLLRQLVEPGAVGVTLDVPDPIGLGPGMYARVYEIVHDGCAALLAELTGPVRPRA